MKISQAFAGSYLKAADVMQPITLTVQSVTMEQIGEERSSKPVVRFYGESRGLVLNKVNGLEISQWYGDDTSGWIGQPVELFASSTFFGGKSVPCVRVRRPTAAPLQAPPAAAPLQAPPAAAPLQAPPQQPVVPYEA